MTEITYHLVMNRPGHSVIEIPLGMEALRSLANVTADDPVNIELIDSLTMHPAASIRAAVASFQCIKKSAIEQLERDAAVDVQRQLVQSKAFQQIVTTERLCELAARDVELACRIADDLSYFTEIDQDAVTDYLSKHPDPSVRIAVARCSSTPRRIRRLLTRDVDADVAQTARDSVRQ